MECWWSEVEIKGKGYLVETSAQTLAGHVLEKR